MSKPQFNRKFALGHVAVLLTAIVLAVWVLVCLAGCEKKRSDAKPFERNRAPVIEGPNVYVLAFGSADSETRNPRGLGSCFRVGDLVYTADHVLRGAGYRDDMPIRIYIMTDIMRRTRVVARYPQRDLAILEPVPGMRSLPAGRYDRTQPVTVEGYSASRGTVLGRGYKHYRFSGSYIGAVNYLQTEYIETTADMVRGMSGGPVMQNGSAVGVHALLSGRFVGETHSEHSGFVLVDFYDDSQRF